MFPSVLNTFNRPSASDRLNSPSHSALHNTVSSALGQVEAVIGIRGDSSVVGTINTVIFSPGSDGGGHVQSANKGGTGQTSYAKGDLLVASSSSVLAKLAVGTDGQILSASSVAAAGIAWIANNSPKVATSGSVITVINTDVETSIMSTTIPGSTLGTANAIRGKVFINAFQTTNQGATFRVSYGATSIATIDLTAGGNVSSINGYLECTLMSRGSTSSQLGTVELRMSRNQGSLDSTSVLGLIAFQKTHVLNQDSNTPLSFGATVKSQGGSENRLDTGGFIIDKIV